MYQQQNKQEIKLWKSAPKNKNKGKTEIMMADKNQLHNYRWEDTLPFYFLAPQIISVKIPIKKSWSNDGTKHAIYVYVEQQDTW